MANRRDVGLNRRVRTELDWEPELMNQEIRVAVKHGVVTLSGLVAMGPIEIPRPQSYTPTGRIACQ